MQTIKSNTTSIIQGKPPRSKRRNDKGYNLSRTHNSKNQKSGRQPTSERLASSNNGHKHRALSPKCESKHMRMQGQGAGSSSNGSTEADSNNSNKENDFIGNFDKENHAIVLEFDPKQSTSIISVDKHDHNSECCNQKEKRQNKRGRDNRNQVSEKNARMKKTEMCRNIEKTGHCKYGDACSYAHDASELVSKTHLPSNYKTKICTQFHDPETMSCIYAERCQFLHCQYDLRDKLSYSKGLKEEARLTWERISQGSDCVFVNLVNGKGCVAPDKRLPIFEQIYNKEDYKAQLEAKQFDKDSRKTNNSAPIETAKSSENLMAKRINKPWKPLFERCAESSGTATIPEQSKSGEDLYALYSELSESL